MLSHNLASIENWILENGWVIISISKISALYLAIKFVLITNIDNRGIKDFIRINLRLPDVNVLVVLTSLYIIFFVTCRTGVKSGETFFLQQLISYAGTIVFFATDIIYYAFLKFWYKDFQKNKSKKNYIYELIIPMLFFISGRLTIPYAKNYTVVVALLSFISFIFVIMNEKKLIEGLLIVIFFSAPMLAFLGEDIVLGNIYSNLIITNPTWKLILFSNVLVTMTYLYFFNKRSER